MTGQKLDTSGYVEAVLEYGKTRTPEAFALHVIPFVTDHLSLAQATSGTAAMTAGAMSRHHILHEGHPIAGMTMEIIGDQTNMSADQIAGVNAARLVIAHANADTDTAHALVLAAANAGEDQLIDLFMVVIDQFVDEFVQLKACHAAAARS